MTIIQESIIMAALWAAAAVNLFIITHICGCLAGRIIGKLIVFFIGTDVEIYNDRLGTVTVHINGFRVWRLMSEMEKCRARNLQKQVRDIEGDL